MNKNQFSTMWRELKGKIKERWNNLTDNDIDHIHGKMDLLSEHLQKKYGWTQERANMEIQRFCSPYGRRAHELGRAEMAGFMEENPVQTYKNRGREKTDFEKFRSNEGYNARTGTSNFKGYRPNFHEGAQDETKSKTKRAG
jgi:uncharacterized protein YjbJ (UPF0337 family)